MLAKIGLTFAAALLAGAVQAQTVGFATLQPGTLLNAQASVIAKVVQDHTKLQVRVIGHGGDHASHLQGRNENLAVADGQISGVSIHPAKATLLA